MSSKETSGIKSNAPGGVEPGRGEPFLVCLALVVATLLPYLSVASHGFINFDDESYVTSNPHVLAGLTLEGIRWAFTSFEVGNWHPLTWLSHMADVSLFGVRPGAHHVVSLLIHAASVALLFLALRRMTGATWRSAVVAALFGIHPLHVESVAWVAERKDVLSGLFFALVLHAYVSRVRNPSPARSMATFAAMAAGLLAKPMLVTTPFLLLLCDVWPLGRTRFAPPACGPVPETVPIPRLFLEKAPLFILSAASCVVTYIAQREGGMVKGLDSLTTLERLSNPLVSCIAYIGKMVWPADLAVLYPYPPQGVPAWEGIAAAAALVAVSLLLVRQLRRAPFLAVGWFWYLGSLVPVIGIVQVGNQAMADRYTYLPLTGLFIAAVWGVGSLAPAAFARGRGWAGAAVVGGLAVLSFLTWHQVGYWKDSVTLYARTLEVTQGNFVVHNMLGSAYVRDRRIPEAIAQFSEAVRLRPDDAQAHNNLGLALTMVGRNDEGMSHMREAYRLFKGR